MSATPKLIKVPDQLTRAAVATTEGEGEQKQTRISISSDTPYLRYDFWNDEEYFEVLDHSPGGFNDSRLKAGLPMLYNHKRDSHLGRAKAFASDGKKITVSDLVWSTSEDAQQKKKDHDEGVLVDTSVGYSLIGEGECVGAKDGIPIYKFKWEPHEFSLVTIPADITVGSGRHRDNKPEGEPREISVRNVLYEETKIVQNAAHPMRIKPDSAVRIFRDPSERGGSETLSIEVVEQREKEAAKRALESEDARRTAIETHAFAMSEAARAQLKKPMADLLREAHAKRMDLNEFRSLIIENWTEAKPLTATEANPKIGMSKKDIRDFRFTKLINEIAENHGKVSGLTGLEKEVCTAAATKYMDGTRNGQVRGAMIPHDILDMRVEESHDLDSTGLRNLTEQVRALQSRTMATQPFNAGGFLVGTDILGGSFIDLLRNATLIGQGPFGVIEINGLVGNIAIPKQNSTATVYWLSEAGSQTESSFTGGQLTFSPHRLTCQSNWTKQLMLQASLSVEMLVRNDQAMALGVEEDRAFIQGSGVAGEPYGLTNTSGVGANITFGGNATWADITNFEYQLENANVRQGEAVFLSTPLTKSYLRATLQVSSSTFPIYLWMPALGEYPNINGVKAGRVGESAAYATKNSPSSNVVIYGTWQNNATKARWGGMDLVVDPYTGAGNETVKTFLNEWLDFGFRYPQAFEVSTDAPTSP